MKEQELKELIRAAYALKAALAKYADEDDEIMREWEKASGIHSRLVMMQEGFGTSEIQ